ncbi:unnamed protein product [Urochloa decumbens]|uniref:Uncharacterized protein n=1 Tax=Urochloa decumbens TaxID=240449 RepID=A0ABC8YW67_9POAL
MAEPQRVVTISSVAEAKQVTKNRAIDEVALLVDAKTPLSSADGIKVPARLHEAFEAMLRAWMKECEQEISRVDLLISTVKEKLAIPDASLPHLGPPANQRNPRNLPLGEYPIFDESAVRFQAPYDSADERTRAIQRDRDSQKALWKLNLQFLEAKKKVLEEKARDLERRVRIVMDKSLESRSLLGAGYADYRLEHTTA